MAEKPIQQSANESYEGAFGEGGYIREMIAGYDDHDFEEPLNIEGEGEFADQDAVLERLQEMPLCLEKLITDHRNEETQWEILLGTGGPATRVLVTTDYRGVVTEAEYQFQDWFQPWTSAENQDEELVRRYAEIVGYYESEK